MHEIVDIDEVTECPRCGGRAFHWRTTARPAPKDPHHTRIDEPGQRAWTCMRCGHVAEGRDAPGGEPPHR